MEKVKSEMEKALAGAQTSISANEAETNAVAYELNSHKTYTMDLAKNMGF